MGYIIVRRDRNLKDEGVLTCTLSLLDVDGFVRVEPTVSPHIEHAFVFPDPFTAYHWLDRLPLDIQQHGHAASSLQWSVREDGDYDPGEVKTTLKVVRPAMRASTDAIAVQEYLRGVKDGERRSSDPHRAFA